MDSLLTSCMYVEGYCGWPVILSVILWLFMQDLLLTTDADDTKLVMKDGDHSLYALMVCFRHLWC